MKRAILIILAILLCITTVGCGSKSSDNQASTSPSAAQQSKPAENTATPSGGSSNGSTKQAVSLAADFPKEVPLIDGLIWGCKKSEITDLKTRQATGNYLFRVNIDANKANVSEVRDFYKSKFTQITREGYVNDNVNSPMAEIDGYIGDWHVAVIACQYNKKGPVETTLVVRHRDTMK